MGPTWTCEFKVTIASLKKIAQPNVDLPSLEEASIHYEVIIAIHLIIFRRLMYSLPIGTPSLDVLALQVFFTLIIVFCGLIFLPALRIKSLQAFQIAHHVVIVQTLASSEILDEELFEEIRFLYHSTNPVI